MLNTFRVGILLLTIIASVMIGFCIYLETLIASDSQYTISFLVVGVLYLLLNTYGNKFHNENKHLLRYFWITLAAYIV